MYSFKKLAFAASGAKMIIFCEWDEGCETNCEPLL